MADHPPIKLIAVDLDGTLLNSQLQISERTRGAVRAAIDRGVEFVLATGKTYPSARDVIPHLGLQSPGVFVQGLVIHNADGSIRSSITIDPEVVRAVAAFGDEHGLAVVAYSEQRLLCREHNIAVELLTRHGDPDAEIVGPLGVVAGQEPVNKVVLFIDPLHMPELRAALADRLGARAMLVQALPNLLEVLPPGASKGRGLLRLLADLGIDARHVLAIGDGENDAEMLRLAGIGVAVANAMPAAKQAADYIVSSNDQDGVAEAIERFVLNGRSDGGNQQ